MSGELEIKLLDRDEFEQRIMEHMAFKGRYLAQGRVIEFVSEQFEDGKKIMQGIEAGLGSQATFDRAMGEAEQILYNLGYRGYKRGYELRSQKVSE